MALLKIMHVSHGGDEGLLLTITIILTSIDDLLWVRSVLMISHPKGRHSMVREGSRDSEMVKNSLRLPSALVHVCAET